MKRYTTKKRLPDIIRSINPSNGLAYKLLEEETFDCIKAEIKINSAAISIPKQPRHYDAKSQRKRARQAERERVRIVLIEKLGPDAFTRFTTRRKRRSLSYRLSQQERSILGYWVDKEKELRRRARRVELAGKRFTYKTYMASAAWERRRNEYWQTHSRLCGVCLTPEHIHLHHMSYKKLGNEPDNHLIALCDAHHKQYHDEHGVQRDMIGKTLSFVRREAAKFSSI